MNIDPLSGLSRPIKVFRNTDFPVPDGPSITELSPGGRVSVTSPQMRWLPKDLVRSVTTTSTPTASSFSGLSGHIGTPRILPAGNDVATRPNDTVAHSC